jgi:hypothetical protein
MNLCNNSGTGVSPVRFKMAVYFAARNTQARRLCHYQHENFNTD